MLFQREGACVKEEAKVKSIHWSLLVFFMAFAGLKPALASPLPIGSIVGSQNAVLDGQQALPNTTVLSGDTLRVDDGVAMVALGQGSRMVVGQDSDASFLQQAEGVTVSLNRGRVSVYQPAAGNGFRVKAGNVTIAPVQGYPTLGDVAMADGLLLVTAKHGALQIEKDGTTQKVLAGKTITIDTRAARAPMPVPPSNRHLKHLRIGAGALLVAGIVAEVGGATTAIILASRTPKAASAITP